MPGGGGGRRSAWKPLRGGHAAAAIAGPFPSLVKTKALPPPPAVYLTPLPPGNWRGGLLFSATVSPPAVVDS